MTLCNKALSHNANLYLGFWFNSPQLFQLGDMEEICGEFAN